MLMTRSALAVVGATTALLTLGATGQATAATPGAASCSVTGASGSATWVYDSKTKISSVVLKVKDTAGDGHHAAIRISTLDANLNAHYWDWRRNYGGSGSTETWNTYLNDTRGIRQVRIDVAVAEGSTTLRSCFSGGRYNPYYGV